MLFACLFVCLFVGLFVCFFVGEVQFCLFVCVVRLLVSFSFVGL